MKTKEMTVDYKLFYLFILPGCDDVFLFTNNMA